MCAKTEHNMNDKKCVTRQCHECGVDKIIAHFQPLAEQTDEVVRFSKWERVKKDVKGKEVVRILQIPKEATCTGLLVELSKELQMLSKHLFVASW